MKTLEKLITSIVRKQKKEREDFPQIKKLFLMIKKKMFQFIEKKLKILIKMNYRHNKMTKNINLTKKIKSRTDQDHRKNNTFKKIKK